MGKNHGPSIQDDDRYEALREDGMSKEKAARIANTPSREIKDKGGPGSYEDWTKEQLYDKAKDVGVEGRSGMSKRELINALRG
jgi:Rho termination factor, N-terminal domain